jgi:hypothetical protein
MLPDDQEGLGKAEKAQARDGGQGLNRTTDTRIFSPELISATLTASTG